MNYSQSFTKVGWFGYNVLFGQYHESDISFGTSIQIRLFFIVKYFMTPNHGKLHATTFETYSNITDKKKKKKTEIALISLPMS